MASKISQSLSKKAGRFSNKLFYFLSWASLIIKITLVSLRVPKLPWKPGILLFTFPSLENAWNLLKNCENLKFLLKTWKKLVLCKFCFSWFSFQDVIFKKILIYVFVISALSTQRLIQSQIDLGFHCIYLEKPGKYMEFCVTSELGTLSLNENRNPLRDIVRIKYLKSFWYVPKSGKYIVLKGIIYIVIISTKHSPCSVHCSEKVLAVLLIWLDF